MPALCARVALTDAPATRFAWPVVGLQPGVAYQFRVAPLYTAKLGAFKQSDVPARTTRTCCLQMAVPEWTLLCICNVPCCRGAAASLRTTSGRA